MAMTSQISSTFIIRCTSDAAEARTVVNPGRRFRIVNILVFNSGGTGNLTVGVVGGATVRAAAATLNTYAILQSVKDLRESAVPIEAAPETFGFCGVAVACIPVCTFALVIVCAMSL